MFAITLIRRCVEVEINVYCAIRYLLIACLFISMWWCGVATPIAWAQEVDPTNRPVKEIRIVGLKTMSQVLVLNSVRLAPGDPYDAEIVSQDISRIVHLGFFDPVVAKVKQDPDGSVIVIYEVTELPLLADVQVLGNKAISDQELLRLVMVRAGDPASKYFIDRGIKRIKGAYEQQGYFIADVTINDDLLQESNILIFRIREGPHLRIKSLGFRGQQAFTEKQLKSQIRSRSYVPIFRKGEFSLKEIRQDQARLQSFYQSRGFLDAEVGRGVPQISPDNKYAVVVFNIVEGRCYLVDRIRVNGNKLFSEEQIRHAMILKGGDYFSADRMRQSQQALFKMYGKFGYLPKGETYKGNTNIKIDQLFHEDQPLVDVQVTIQEGKRYVVGKVSIIGNQLTQQRVIQRELRGLYPDRPFDYEGVARTTNRLNRSRLFQEGQVTIRGEPEDDIRDVVVEVVEKNTGSISFGAGFSSDSGVIGALDFAQSNFDIRDVPESVGELFGGKAFRGAGQYFGITLSPGDENSRYSVSFREPYFMDLPYSLDMSGFFYQRQREDWDEARMGGRFGIGQRFGDVYTATIRFRSEDVDIDDIDPIAPVDVFAVAGESSITSVGATLTRDTTDNFIFPSRGSRTQLSISRAGALGGEYDFTRAEGSWKTFWTVDEDFFGRKSILSVRVQSGYIFEENEAPLFDRFYAGGSRTMRGFDFRGVGPRGLVMQPGGALVQGNDPVGGDWLFLFGIEYSVPIFSTATGMGAQQRDVIRGVLFTDTGTSQAELGFDEYRVSAGAGLRISVPFLGQVPIALDVGYPLVKEDGDEQRIFNIDISLPLR